jgi:hypothetical protein
MLPQRFRYGLFNRVGILVVLAALLGVVPYAAAQRFHGVSPAAAFLYIVSVLLIGWFALLRATVVVVGNNGIRSCAFGMTRVKMSWDEVAKISEASVGRGMKSVTITPKQSEPRSRKAISVISDVVDYQNLKTLLTAQAKARGIPLYRSDAETWNACRTDEERAIWKAGGSPVDRL